MSVLKLCKFTDNLLVLFDFQYRGAWNIHGRTRNTVE